MSTVGVEERAVNKKQTFVLWVGIIIIAGMLIYPPWQFSFQAQGRFRYEPLGCDWLWSPPSFGTDKGLYKSVAYFDKTRLSIQIAIVIMVCSGFILTFKK